VNGFWNVEERIRRLLTYAQDAEARGDGDVARTFRAMARDLGPAPAARVARSM
jgi:hypothetical protein